MSAATGERWLMAGEAARRRIHRMLDGAWTPDVLDRLVSVLLIALISLNVAAVLVESVGEYAARYEREFFLFEVFSVAIFTIEYVLRVWSSTESPLGAYKHPVTGRIRYALSPMAVFDLLAIAPFYLALFFAVDLRFLRVFRLLRILKLTRYSPAGQLLANALYQERRPLLSALLLMFVLLIFASSLVYLAEHEAQPDAFGSIPAAMWWGMATLTTVGYGDVTPVTGLGKLLGGFVAILGIGMFALPAGILASSFSQQMKKRDFIVSWKLVARVRLFRDLRAEQIAEIASLLTTRQAVPGEELFRQGDEARRMYFIVSGEVNVDAAGRTQRLGEGEFFGEIALLNSSGRTATVTAQKSCLFLVLDRDDFQDLISRDTTIRDTVQCVAAKRAQQLDANQAPGRASCSSDTRD
jgi:voltage-gated potassium channel